MAKIPRITQKIFAENAGSNEVTAFGTAKNGDDAEYTKDVSKIQTEAFTQGWEPALLTDDAPFMEDMNAVLLAQSQQIAYQFQEGIAEWDNQTTYYKFSIVKKVINEELKLFYSLTDDNIGNDPEQDTFGTNWKELSLGGEAQYKIGDPIITFSNTLEENEIWLEGAIVSRTDYPNLYIVYGTTYGAGDGSTTFGLPDCTDRTFWGAISFGYIEAGLPNIKGNLYSEPKHWGPLRYGGSTDGAIFYINNTQAHSLAGEPNTFEGLGLGLDASKYNSLYNDEVKTVQTPSIKIRVKTRYK